MGSSWELQRVTARPPACPPAWTAARLASPSARAVSAAAVLDETEDAHVKGRELIQCGLMKCLQEEREEGRKLTADILGVLLKY